MKLLLIILVVVAALMLLRGVRIEVRTSSRSGPNKPDPQTNRAQTNAPTPGSGLPVQMVSCAFCGLHLPREEAFGSPDQRYYCSEAHRIEHVRQSPADSTRGAR